MNRKCNFPELLSRSCSGQKWPLKRYDIRTGKMLDTVRVTGEWPLKTSQQGGRLITFGCIKLRFARCGAFLTSAEVSLPKLLFGHNGRVLKDQSELSAALKKFANELSRVAEVPLLDDLQPWRIDLAWNF